MKIQHIIVFVGLRIYFFFNVYLKVCDRSRSPQWNEAFYFLVRDPTEEMLIVKVNAVFVSQY